MLDNNVYKVVFYLEMICIMTTAYTEFFFGLFIFFLVGNMCILHMCWWGMKLWERYAWASASYHVPAGQANLILCLHLHVLHTLVTRHTNILPVYQFTVTQPPFGSCFWRLISAALPSRQSDAWWSLMLLKQLCVGRRQTPRVMLSRYAVQNKAAAPHGDSGDSTRWNIFQKDVI